MRRCEAPDAALAPNRRGRFMPQSWHSMPDVAVRIAADAVLVCLYVCVFR